MMRQMCSITIINGVNLVSQLVAAFSRLTPGGERQANMSVDKAGWDGIYLMYIPSLPGG